MYNFCFIQTSLYKTSLLYIPYFINQRMYKRQGIKMGVVYMLRVSNYLQLHCPLGGIMAGGNMI